MQSPQSGSQPVPAPTPAPVHPPTRFICIHGHFYQPPRESPWLEEIEVQDSAYPYHDWNERITAECYEPNAYARILDRDGHIARIVSTYERISWNFGPTLLSWMEAKAPRVYRAILDADAASQRRFSGHGSALAQAYNHAILPLANSRDKATQVLWGVRDFVHRFGRAPEGMWLPETAVDLETLDLLAQQGIRFTILAPHQARAVRPLGDATGAAEGAHPFHETSHGSVDPTMPYQVFLPSGRSIAVFFYDGPIARAVAFERLLNKGEYLADRLLGALPPWPREHDERPRLVHIATDGETYGHHHTYGEMALAYALAYLESSPNVELTNYGEFLARHPPTHEAQIVPNTAWSCSHGVERWRSDCGCNSGGRHGWHQGWRGPLRAALDSLRDAIAPHFERLGGELLRDPWAARDGYIDVMLARAPGQPSERSDEARQRFLDQHARAPLTEAGQITVWKLMEMQRHAQLMYTSCGWFFDDIGGPEPTQDIQYAGRVIQLARELFDADFETPVLEILSRARGNTSEFPDGRTVYERAVRPAVVDLTKVGAHVAMTTLLRGPEPRVRCFQVEQEGATIRQSGRLKLGLGRARVTSDVTRESADLCYGVLHLGDHNLAGGIRRFPGAAKFQQIEQELLGGFLRADVPGVLRAIDTHFGTHEGRDGGPRTPHASLPPGAPPDDRATYSLKQLFRDDQRTLVRQILNTTLAEVESEYRQIYENHAPLMRFLADLGVPQPRALLTAADFALNQSVRRALDAEPPDLTQVKRLLDEAERAGVHLEGAALGFSMAAALDRLLDRLAASKLRRAGDLTTLERLEAAIRLASAPPFSVNLWRTQNGFYALLQNVYQTTFATPPTGESAPSSLTPSLLASLRASLLTVAELLRVRVLAR